MTTTKLILDRFIPYRLSVASNAVSSRISQSYRKRFGLKVAEWRIIAILAEQVRMTPQSLGEATRMDKITVSRASTALVDRGLLAAEENPGDGRSHFLALSTDGRALYDEIAPTALAMEAELLNCFSSEEREALEKLLLRLETAASNQTDLKPQQIP
jgi:DNA-binding MarR family transcriptional regulator